MSCNAIDNELKLYYQDKYYSWNELTQHLQMISTDSSTLIISAQEHFSTVIHILYGMLNKKVIFPVSPDLLEKKEDLFSSIPMTKQSVLAIATSGTQSKPKIVTISDKNITSHCQSFAQKIPMGNTSVWLNCMPLNHIAGIMIVYRCWFNNASMLLHEGFKVQKVWEDIHRFSVTHISLVPRMLSRLLDHCKDSNVPQSLQFILVGGDKIADSLLQRAIDAGWPIYLSYSMTEATSTIAIGQSSDTLIPLPGFDIQLTQSHTLKIKGEMVSQSAVDSQGWYESNDLVTWMGHYLLVQGRNDDMIISGGKNISPQYLEALLSVSPAIDDIAIAKVSNDEWGDTIVALFCGNLQQFKDWVKTEILLCYQPKIFIKLELIPRNGMGKIDRKAIRDLIKQKDNYN